MKSIVAIVALLFLPIANADEKIQDRTVIVTRQDPEMLKAIEQAQASLGDFLKIKANPPKGATAFKVKVKITDSNVTEHMWVTPFRELDSGFVRTLADEPDYVHNVVNGQTLKFTRSDISDWGYELDGKQKGSFTVCVIFKHLPPAEVQKYRRDYGFEC